MKVHKVTLLVIDHNDVGADDVATTLENTNYPADCISPRVVSVETAEVAWQDDDPLNHRQSHREAFAALFGKQPLATVEAEQMVFDLINFGGLRQGEKDQDT